MSASSASPLPKHPKTVAAVPGLTLATLADHRIVERLKVMDKYNFPVAYTEKYYTSLVQAGWHQFNLLAYYYEILVGSLTCRLEATDVEGAYRLYIMTIGVLPAYRRMGIGAMMMQELLERVYQETSVVVKEVALHVQVGSPALQFYVSFGFEVVEEVKDYYRELEVRDATLVRRVVPQPNLKVKDKKK